MSQNKNLPTKLLVVDDDPSDLTSIKNMLGAEAINVTTCPDWQSAMYAFNQQRFDMAIVELELEGLPGAALIQKWRASADLEKRKTIFVISTNMQLNAQHYALIQELGQIGEIKKPFKWANVMNTMVKCVMARDQAKALDRIESSVLRPLLDKKQFPDAVMIAESKLATLGGKGLEMAGNTFEECLEYEMALQAFEKLRMESPNNLRFLNAIGRLNLRLGNLKVAKDLLEKANQLAPAAISRLEQLAELYLQGKDPTASIAKYKEIIKLTPENPDMKFGFFERLQDAGFEQEAKEFSKELSTSIELIRFYNNNGVMHSKSEDFKAAIKEYDRALFFAKGSKELYRILYNKAIALINLKAPEALAEAHVTLEQCLQLNPEFTKAHEKLKVTAPYATNQQNSA
jgi:tetratricopeptide (TPR) repeat protein